MGVYSNKVDDHIHKIAALSQLSDEELKENVPPVLQRLIETADHILKGDKNENCAS